MNLYAIDVSGSMPLQPFSDFLDGIVPLFQDGDLIVAFDTEITAIFTPDTFSGINHSYGGSDPQCILDFIAKENINPSNIVVMTDGYIGDGVQIPNAIYLIIPKGTGSIIKHGQVVHMYDSWILPLAMCMN